jgi:ribosome-binding ATPase YchF (GTP1/OBG family)
MIYKELNLLTFFTIERGKLRAWGVTQGTSAYTASGFIHSDIQKGFVKAEVVNFKDLENIESNLKIASTADLWHEARSLGLTRFESRNYLIKDADIISFKFTS